MARILMCTVNDDGAYEFILFINRFTNTKEECFVNKFSLNQSTEWSLRIYPDGAKPENKEYVSIMLCSHNKSRPTIEAFFSCSEVYKSDEKHKKSMTHQFKYDEEFGWPRFCPKGSLYTYNRDLKLSIKIKLLFVKFDPDSVLKDPVYSLKPGTRQKLFTDLTVKVQGKEIKAHKIYLAEASEKFLEMLSKDPNENVLEVMDLDFEIAEKIIQFIYEDKIEGIENSAEVLLIAADEYKMARLKNYCEKSLWDNLTIENVIETLRFSINNGCNKLKTECIEFMARHISVIPETGWTDFIKDSTGVFVKLFKRFAILNYEKISLHFNKLPELMQGKIEFKIREAAQDFHHLYLKEKTADVKLKIGGKFLKAHKAVLSSFSDVFKAMFEHDTKESRENQIVIIDFDMKTMREVLRYIYCGKVTWLKEWALKLLPAADYYNLSELAENCEKSLMINLEYDNLADVYEVADRHNRPQLKQRVLAHFWKDILQRMQMDDFVEWIKGKPEFIDCAFKDLSKILCLTTENSNDIRSLDHPIQARQTEDSD